MTEVACKNLCYVAVKMIRRKKMLRSGKMFAVTLTKRKADETRPSNRVVLAWRGAGEDTAGRPRVSPPPSAATRRVLVLVQPRFFFWGGDFPCFPQCAYITFIIIYVKKSLFWKKAFNDLDTGVPVFAITWAHLFLSVTAGGHPSRGPRGYSEASRASGNTDRRGGVAWKAPHLLGATVPPQHLALGARRPAPAPAPAASPLPREPAAPPPGGQPAHGIAPFPGLISAGSQLR